MSYGRGLECSELFGFEHRVLVLFENTQIQGAIFSILISIIHCILFCLAFLKTSRGQTEKNGTTNLFGFVSFRFMAYLPL